MSTVRQGQPVRVSNLGDDAQNQPVDLTPEFLASRMEMARRIARRYRSAFRGDYDSAESTAMLGLTLAAKQFDPSKSPDFDAFACSVIGRLMVDEFRISRTIKRGGLATRDYHTEPTAIHQPHAQVDAKDFADALLAGLPDKDRSIVVDLVSGRTRSTVRGEFFESRAVAKAHGLGERTVQRLWSKTAVALRQKGAELLRGGDPAPIRAVPREAAEPTVANEPAPAPAPTSTPAEPIGPEADEFLPTLREVEERHIRRVLEKTRGDKPAAARILGICLKTLYNRAGSFEASPVTARS